MSEQLLAKLAPRLKRLDEGAYERAYRVEGGSRPTSTHQLVSSLLASLNVRYREKVRVPGSGGVTADFVVNGVFVFVERDLGGQVRKSLARGGKKAIVIE